MTLRAILLSIVASGIALLLLVFGYYHFASWHVDQLASILGVGISILGFVLTVGAVVASRKASNEARDAALVASTATSAIFRNLGSYATIARCREVVPVLSSLSVLILGKAYGTSRDSVAALRNLLVEMQSDVQSFSDEERSTMAAITSQLATFEKTLAKVLLAARDATVPERTLMLDVLREQEALLRDIVTKAQRRLEQKMSESSKAVQS